MYRASERLTVVELGSAEGERHPVDRLNEGVGGRGSPGGGERGEGEWGLSVRPGQGYLVKGEAYPRAGMGREELKGPGSGEPTLLPTAVITSK